MLIDPFYYLYLKNSSGELEKILGPEYSPWKIRNVANKIKEKPHRKVVITKNNKVLPGGKSALDKYLLEIWLVEREEGAVES